MAIVQGHSNNVWFFIMKTKEIYSKTETYFKIMIQSHCNTAMNSKLQLLLTMAISLSKEKFIHMDIEPLHAEV